MKIKNIFLTAAMLIIPFWRCSNDDNNDPEPEAPPVVEEPADFAKGADVSWMTKMEKAGKKFYDASGRETECMALLKSLAMNSIRLRVW